MLDPSKLTYLFHTKEEISRLLQHYVRLPPRKKKEIRNLLQKEEEAKANELLSWYFWWDEYHN